MKSTILNQIKPFLTRGLAPALLATAILSLGTASPAWAGGNPGVLPPQSHPYGQSYGQWSADWWTWFMEHPVTGHPSVDDSLNFDVSSGQQGKVWFLGSPFGTVERTVTIPTGKALFVGLINAEASDLEGLGDTEEAQRETAAWLADHIVSVSCSVDGKPVKHMERYRVQSPQFSFFAPEPWVFSPAPGGEGTAVADGYFVMLAPLSKGKHTIHFTGSFRFEAGEFGPEQMEAVEFGLDVTYNINVTRRGHDRDEDGDCDQD